MIIDLIDYNTIKNPETNIFGIFYLYGRLYEKYNTKKIRKYIDKLIYFLINKYYKKHRQIKKIQQEICDLIDIFIYNDYKDVFNGYCKLLYKSNFGKTLKSIYKNISDYRIINYSIFRDKYIEFEENNTDSEYIEDDNWEDYEYDNDIFHLFRYKVGYIENNKLNNLLILISKHFNE